MAIGNHNDLTHIVRTSDQWKNTYDKYELIPSGVLCVELVSSDVTKIKIGDGHNIFSKLPYIGDLDLSKYYTKLETDTRIKEILTQEKVVRIKGLIGSKSDLPADARCGDIYFVRQLSSSDNKYIEYIYSPDNTWEPLGGIPVDIDLSEYAKTAYVDDKIEQVNERIDDIEQHGTHTHPNKEILDQITEPYTTADKETLASLHNYDDTEIREMISQSSHTHSNKDILDATSAAFTKEDKSKLDQLNPYDDSILKEKITALERLAHEHSNKRILDQTTASFTKEYERKMRWIRIYTGCTGMEEGIAGLVPAAQAGEEDYVLSGSGEWVPQTGGGGTYELPIASASTLGGIKVGDGLEIDANGKLSVVGGGGGGDSIAEGGGISITTDPQTGVKTISVNTGDNLEVDPNTGELNVTDVDYEAGQGIHIGADYTLIEYIKNSGNYDQIIITDIIPVFSDKIELDIKFGAATVETVSDDKFFGCYNNSSAAYSYYGSLYLSSNSYANIGIYNHFKYESGNTGDNFFTYPDGISYDGTSSVRHTLTVQGSTANWNNSTRNFSSYYNQSFSDPQIGIAIFGMNKVSGDADCFSQCNLTVYGVKLYDSNNTLLHDLRPAERGANGEAGLYDLVTHRFYGNAGNGSFVKGPAITSPDRLISAKIGNGLDFDSNNAIEVVTGNGLSVNQDNELEVNTGNGLQINQDGELEIDPSIIPEVMEYSSGEAITIRDVSSTLPAGYVEVDYIEGIGNYTVIDYIPNRKTKIVGTASQMQTSSDPVLFGNRTGSSGQQFVFWFNRYDSTRAKVGFVYGTNTWSTSSDCDNGKLIPYTLEDQFTFLISLDDEFNINDSFVHNITENGAPASNLKLGIFALVNTSSDEIESSDQIFRGRIYEFKIYEDDELVINLIPAISTSTNQGGFYDVINDIFYTSKTATPFGYDSSTIHSTGKVIDVKYGNGLTVNQSNELEVVLSDGLQFDSTASETLVADKLYLFNSRVTCQVHTDNYYSTSASFDRTYQKTTTEPALCCIWEVGDSDHLWTGPLLVGLTETSVQYTTQDTSQTVNYQNTFTYLGKTWYTSGYPDFLNDADHEDKVDHLQYLGSYSTTADQIQAAKDLIDLANVRFVSNAGIQAKLGNGLSFDANGAIQADAQPLSPATDSTLGGVIVGEGINVDEYGEISLSAGEGLDIDFESHIPSEYTLIKGISSVGHNDLPYINTGYLIKPTSRIVMRGVLYKTTSGWAFPIGVRHNNYSNPVMFCTHHNSNGDSIELWLPNDTLIASAIDREKCYNDPVTVTISSDGLNIENETTGEVVTLTTSDTLPTASLPLYIFATNDNYTISFPGPMDLYRLQIFEGTTKVLDYLPCKRNSDNKYGVYDIVANEYKASSNVALFEPVTGTPSGDDLIQQIKLLPATENTIGGVIVGDGILVDNDGTISVDPTIIPEVPTYEAGTAISIEDVEHGGVTFDAWDSGTGWENICYSNSTGNSITSYQYEAHSPISNSYTLPAGATHIRAIAYNQNDTMLWTSFSWIDSNDYHFASTSPEDDHYDDWFEIPTGAVKVNFGVRHSKLNTTTAMSLNDIKSVDITVQTVSEIEVDVWNGGTGWLNGGYSSGTSNDFYTNWYYTYHYNYQQYIEVPEGATHVMVQGISNDNDSHFEGGGCNVFDSNHNHVHWFGCAWQWHELSSDVKYVQPNVKWDDANSRTISGSDVKSVTLVWKLPALEINQAINVKYGDGLTVNQNNELEVNLGSGLQFDANGAIEVTGGGGGDTIAEGDGIEITTDQQTGVKTIGINVGNGLDIDPLTNELFVNGQLPEGTIIKKMTYVGNGSGSSNVIKFTKKPVGILSINGSSGTNYISAIPASINSEYLHGVYGGVSTNGNSCSCRMSYNDATNELTFTQAYSGNNDPGLIYNANDRTYTMQYLVKGHAGSGTSETNMVSVVKTFSYVGTGTSTNNIQFPETPDMLLSIAGIGGDNTYLTTTPTPMDASKLDFAISDGNNNNGVGGALMSFNDTTNVLTLTSSRYDSWAFNASGVTYQVRYIVNEVISSSIGGGTNYLPGEGIEFTELTSSVYADKIRLEITNIKNYSSQQGPGAPYCQMRYFEFSDSNHTAHTVVSGTAIWSDGTTVEYPSASESIDVMIDDIAKMCVEHFDGTKSLVLTFDLDSPVLYEDLQYFRYKTGADVPERDPISWKVYFNNVDSINNWNLAGIVDSATITNNREEWTQYFPLTVNEFNSVVISATGGSGDTVAEGNGISITTDQQTGEKVIAVDIGSGLAFDPQTGAINVTGGGDTVAEGAGISITTDQQTGDKVIAINTGSGLQVNQTTNELEVSSGVVTSIAPTQNTPGSITVTEGDGTATPISVISQMGGATSSTAGTAGYVPAPAAGDDDAYLRGDGTWDDSVVTEDDELTLVFVPDDYQPS